MQCHFIPQFNGPCSSLHLSTSTFRTNNDKVAFATAKALVLCKRVCGCPAVKGRVEKYRQLLSPLAAYRSGNGGKKGNERPAIPNSLKKKESTNGQTRNKGDDTKSKIYQKQGNVDREQVQKMPRNEDWEERGWERQRQLQFEVLPQSADILLPHQRRARGNYQFSDLDEDTSAEFSANFSFKSLPAYKPKYRAPEEEEMEEEKGAWKRGMPTPKPGHRYSDEMLWGEVDYEGRYGPKIITIAVPEKESATSQRRRAFTETAVGQENDRQSEAGIYKSERSGKMDSHRGRGLQSGETSSRQNSSSTGYNSSRTDNNHYDNTRNNNSSSSYSTSTNPSNSNTRNGFSSSSSYTYGNGQNASYSHNSLNNGGSSSSYSYGSSDRTSSSSYNYDSRDRTSSTSSSYNYGGRDRTSSSYNYGTSDRNNSSNSNRYPRDSDYNSNDRSTTSSGRASYNSSSSSGNSNSSIQNQGRITINRDVVDRKDGELEVKRGLSSTMGKGSDSGQQTKWLDSTRTPQSGRQSKWLDNSESLEPPQQRKWLDNARSSDAVHQNKGSNSTRSAIGSEWEGKGPENSDSPRIGNKWVDETKRIDLAGQSNVLGGATSTETPPQNKWLDSKRSRDSRPQNEWVDNTRNTKPEKQNKWLPSGTSSDPELQSNRIAGTRSFESGEPSKLVESPRIAEVGQQNKWLDSSRSRGIKASTKTDVWGGEEQQKSSTGAENFLEITRSRKGQTVRNEGDGVSSNEVVSLKNARTEKQDGTSSSGLGDSLYAASRQQPNGKVDGKDTVHDGKMATRDHLKRSSSLEIDAHTNSKQDTKLTVGDSRRTDREGEEATVAAEEGVISVSAAAKALSKEVGIETSVDDIGIATEIAGTAVRKEAGVATVAAAAAAIGTKVAAAVSSTSSSSVAAAAAAATAAGAPVDGIEVQAGTDAMEAQATVTKGTAVKEARVIKVAADADAVTTVVSKEAELPVTGGEVVKKAEAAAVRAAVATVISKEADLPTTGRAAVKKAEVAAVATAAAAAVATAAVATAVTTAVSRTAVSREAELPVTGGTVAKKAEVAAAAVTTSALAGRAATTGTDAPAASIAASVSILKEAGAAEIEAAEVQGPGSITPASRATSVVSAHEVQEDVETTPAGSPLVLRSVVEKDLGVFEAGIGAMQETVSNAAVSPLVSAMDAPEAVVEAAEARSLTVPVTARTVGVKKLRVAAVETDVAQAAASSVGVLAAARVEALLTREVTSGVSDVPAKLEESQRTAALPHSKASVQKLTRAAATPSARVVHTAAAAVATAVEPEVEGSAQQLSKKMAVPGAAATPSARVVQTAAEAAATAVERKIEGSAQQLSKKTAAPGPSTVPVSAGFIVEPYKPTVTAAHKMFLKRGQSETIKRTLREGMNATNGRPFRLYRYAVDDLRLFKALEEAGLKGRVVVTDSIERADAVIASKKKRSGKIVSLKEAEAAANNAGVPFLAVPTVSAVRLLDVLGPLIGVEVPAHIQAARAARAPYVRREANDALLGLLKRGTTKKVKGAASESSQDLDQTLLGVDQSASPVRVQAPDLDDVDLLGEEERQAPRNRWEVEGNRYRFLKPIQHGSKIAKRKLVKKKAAIQASW